VTREGYPTGRETLWVAVIVLLGLVVLAWVGMVDLGPGSVVVAIVAGAVVAGVAAGRLTRPHHHGHALATLAIIVVPVIVIGGWGARGHGLLWLLVAGLGGVVGRWLRGRQVRLERRRG
jgi:hypothetical protein